MDANTNTKAEDIRRLRAALQDTDLSVLLDALRVRMAVADVTAAGEDEQDKRSALYGRLMAAFDAS